MQGPPQGPPPGYGPPPGGYPPPQGGYPPQQGYGPPPGYGPPGQYGQQSFGQVPPPKKGGLPWYAWAGIVMVVLFGGCIATCALIGKGISDKAAKDKEDFEKQDAIKISAVELSSAYKKNEVAGDEKYKGKKIEVTGDVDSIDSGVNDEPIVHLTGSELFNSVMLNGIPKGEASKLEKGKKLTAVCKGDGEIIGSPVLKDCKIK